MERIEVIQDKIEYLKRDIPEKMLEECEWFHPLEGTSSKDLAITNTENAVRFERCYYLNNAKVQFLKTLRQDYDR